MVLRAPHAGRIFLEPAKARDRLAGVEQGHARAIDRVDVTTREGGDAGQVLDDVERRALGGQQGPRFAPQANEIGTGFDPIPVLDPAIDPPHRPSYRAILRDPKGREIWRDEGLQLNDREALSLSLPSTLLAPGDYTIEVDDRRFAFRVLK